MTVQVPAASSSAGVTPQSATTVKTPGTGAAPPQDGRPTAAAAAAGATSLAERSNSNTPSLQNAVVVDKKKGY